MIPTVLAEAKRDEPAKPPFGAACNGCGVCCASTACPPAVRLVDGAEAGQPCPALEWDRDRYWCGLVRDPARYLTAGRQPQDEASVAASVADALFDGRCDAGPPDGLGIDEFEGWTARDYLDAMDIPGMEWFSLGPVR